MKEVWETPFGNATLKINRADKHISDIGERLFASSHTYGPSLHVDGQTGKHFIHYAFTDKELRSDIALMVGDAIHNIRSALDYAWISALERLNPGSINGFTKFPIDPNGDRKKYESTLKVKIPAASFPFRFLVEHVKPY
ncbi:MAG TPA: hypothetical protein VGR96_17225, partial [Acidobacteriaceae bacterium]|nr:hypothetical protein [Acidobacteriaceae bacterium]